MDDLQIEWQLNSLIPTYDFDNGDFWYDLTWGGYLKPEDFLSNPDQVTKIKDAVNVLQSFEQCLRENCEIGFEDE